MQIYVNNQKLNAELAGEKHLGEIYSAVCNWSNDNRKYIYGIRVDNREVAVNNLKAIPVDEAERIDFYIGDELEMLSSSIRELDRYVDQMGGHLFEMEQLSDDDKINLREGLQWIRQIMEPVATILRLDLAQKKRHSLIDLKKEKVTVMELLDELEVLGNKMLRENDKSCIEAFLEYLREFKLSIMELELNVGSVNAGAEEIMETIEDFENNLQGFLESIVEINASFNAGRDLEALESLEIVTTKLNRYISALLALDYRLVQESESGLAGITLNNVSFRERVDLLTSLLRDLSTALEENDIVAAGDILEYEMTELLSELSPYLTKIRQLMIARYNTSN